jgi:hypothetical protein
MLAVVLGLAPGFAAWADDGASHPAVEGRPSPTFQIPLTLAVKTDACDAKATLPPEASIGPNVLATVSADATRWLWDLADRAAAAQADLSDQDWWRPYSGALAFHPTFASRRVVSLLGEWWQDTGGAHPNSGVLAENIDPKSGAPVEWTDLFPASGGGSAIPPAVLKYVRKDLMRQKRERLGDGFDAATARDFMRDLGKDAPVFTFAGSAVPGRARGLTLHFPPYAVGAYVEGTYTVELPVATFAGRLAPAWRDVFTPPR